MEPCQAHLEIYEIRAIAVAASVDPRSVKRLLTGQPVRPMIRDRIVKALKERGFLHLVAVSR